MTISVYSETHKDKLRANLAKARDTKNYRFLLRRRADATNYLNQTDHLVRPEDRVHEPKRETA